MMLFGHISVETPNYKLLKKYPTFEIRKYAQRIQASVDQCKGDNDGFRQLASYIFGNNIKQDKSQKIQMTAPVLTQNETINMTAPVLTQNEKKGNQMSFIMPSQYQELNQLPTPKNENIKLNVIPSAIYAVKTFTWQTDHKACLPLVDSLKHELKAEGIPIKSEDFVLARYNPPFTIPFLRTNEIWIPVDYKDEYEQ